MAKRLNGIYRLSLNGGYKMIASVYIKDGNICLFNESMEFTDLGGVAYELGKPLLDFICYEPERFEDGFNTMAEAFDNDFAHIGAKSPEFISQVKSQLMEAQQKEVYLFFYYQMLMEFIYGFIESPGDAVTRLAEVIPAAGERLRWAMDFEWPSSKSSFVQVAVFADKERRLFRAAKEL
jgi:hypothetical protein